MLKAAQKALSCNLALGGRDGGGGGGVLGLFQHDRRVFFSPANSQTAIMCAASIKVYSLFTKPGRGIKGSMPLWVILKVKSSPLTSHPAVSHQHGARWWGGVKTRMHITGKTLLNGVQKKKKACSSCGEKKTNYVNLLSNNRAIFHAVWKTRRISKAPRRYGELSDNRGGCRSTGSCNWVQSLITGGVSFICLSGKKKKNSVNPGVHHQYSTINGFFYPSTCDYILELLIILSELSGGVFASILSTF